MDTFVTIPANLDRITYNYTIRGGISGIQSNYYQQTTHYGSWPVKAWGTSYNGNPIGVTYSTKYKDPSSQTLKETETMNWKYSYNNDELKSASSVDLSGSDPVSDYKYREAGGSDPNNLLQRHYKGSEEDGLYMGSPSYKLERIYEQGTNEVALLPIQYTSLYGDDVVTFFYDANGNLFKDLNRGIVDIDYNILNLPNKISFENGSNIRYRYDADGVKRRADYKIVFNQLFVPIGAPTSYGSLFVEHHTDFCDNLVYEDNVLKKVRIDGGYINYNSSTNNGEYCYYIQDQIGNNRVIVSEQRSIIQYADYYPFGIPFSEMSMDEDNMFHAGKELEKMHGLYWYDNGKRWYDPILCRFTTMDPLCEKYYDKNPYSYCGDNPMKYGDVRGDTISTIVHVRVVNPDGTDRAIEYIYYYRRTKDGRFAFVDKDGNLYTGDDAFVEQLSKALGELRKGSRGRKLVNELANSKTRNVYIHQNYGKNKSDVGGRFIRWNPSLTRGGIDSQGSTERPAYIGLGHEMAHIEDIWEGTCDLESWEGKTPIADIYATHVENQIRAEHGLFLRTHYSDNGSVGDPNNAVIIEGTNQSMYYKMARTRSNVSVTVPFMYYLFIFDESNKIKL